MEMNEKLLINIFVFFLYFFGILKIFFDKKVKLGIHKNLKNEKA